MVVTRRYRPVRDDKGPRCPVLNKHGRACPNGARQMRRLEDGRTVLLCGIHSRPFDAEATHADLMSRIRALAATAPVLPPEPEHPALPRVSPQMALRFA